MKAIDPALIDSLKAANDVVLEDTTKEAASAAIHDTDVGNLTTAQGNLDTAWQAVTAAVNS